MTPRDPTSGQIPEYDSNRNLSAAGENLPGLPELKEELLQFFGMASSSDWRGQRAGIHVRYFFLVASQTGNLT